MRHDRGMTETEKKWSERVRDWRASGRSAAAYAEGREFKGSTLRFWASNLRRVVSAETAQSGATPRVRMLRVVPRSAPTEGTIEVIVGGASVVVRGGFDGGLLRQVVAALGGES
jgi:transposase